MACLVTTQALWLGPMSEGKGPYPALAAAGAIMLLGTVIFYVLAVVIAPAFGITVGAVPDTVIGMMIVSFLVLVGAVSGAVFDRWRGNGK